MTHRYPLDGDRTIQAMTQSRKVFAAARLITRLAMTTSKLCEEQGLTLSQYRCLVRVMSGPVRASAMAEYMGISRPTLSSIVRNLERRGLVERVRADEDGRGVAVSATPKAIRAVAAVDRRMTEFVDELSRELGLQTFLELARGLEGPVDVVANGVRARSSMRSA